MKKFIILVTIIAVFFIAGFLYMNKVNKKIPESSKLVYIFNLKEEDVLYGSS